MYKYVSADLSQIKVRRPTRKLVYIMECVGRHQVKLMSAHTYVNEQAVRVGRCESTQWPSADTFVNVELYVWAALNSHYLSAHAYVSVQYIMWGPI